MQTAPAPETRSGREDYLDHLRVFLTALVVCHHQAIAFGAPGGWYYVAAAPGDIVSLVVMTLFVAVNQAYFMSLLFFVSAYFTRMSLLKKGVPAFVKGRAIRLLVPLAVFFFLLNPSVIHLARFFRGEAEAGYAAFMLKEGWRHFGLGPMWFVFALILFTAGYLACAGCRKSDPARRPLPGNFSVFVFVLSIGAITFLVRLMVPLGAEAIGLQLGYFPLYICMFAFGIVAHGSGWLDHLGARQANAWFALALAAMVLLPVIVVLGGALKDNGDAFRGGLSWQAFAYAAWEPFICVGVSMKLVCFFRERLGRANTLAGRLSKSSYAVYIIHPFFVVTATFLAKDLPLPPLAVVLFVCPLVLVATFACANLLRQAPVLNKIL